MPTKIVETPLLFDPNCIVRKVVEIPESKSKEKKDVEDETKVPIEISDSDDEISSRTTSRKGRK